MVNELLIQLKESAPDTNRLRILVELGKFHIYKPGEAKADLDSAFSYLTEAQVLNKKLKNAKWHNETESMIVIGHMERHDFEGGRALLAQLINEFEKKGYKEAEAALRLKFGIWLSTNEKNYPELFLQYSKALSIYQQSGNQEREIQVLLAIASIHVNQGKLDLAETELQKIIRRYKAINYQKLHYAYNLLSNIYRLKGDFNKGLHCSIRCLESMESTHDTLSAAAFYGDLGQLYLDAGNRKKSVESYTNALESWRREGLPNFAMYHSAGFIVQNLIEQKKPAEALDLITGLSNQIPPITKLQKGCVAQNMAYCYEALQKHKEAEKWYLKSVELYNETGNDFEPTERIQFDIGKFYAERKQFAKAGNYLRKALSYSPQKNALATIRDAHLMLFMVDSAAGNFLSAIQHLQQNKQLNDSIFNDVKSRQIEELQIQYETEKQKQNIQLLNRSNKEQGIKLHESNIIKNFTFFGLALLLVIIFLLYYQYKIKQHNNQEMGKKNNALQHLVDEKEWLLKEIHHRVKNNLQIVISLLNTQSKYLDSKEAKDAIRESRHRMQAMSLIHQKLYQTENSTSVNMKNYIHELTEYLERSFDTGNNIRFDLTVNAVELDISQAIPIGLILNEAITNAIKYAFNGSTKGMISITMKALDNNNIMMEVCDNGVGLPQNYNFDNADTMGMRLMKGLVKQIEGKLTIKNNPGVSLRIEFATDTVLKSFVVKGLPQRASILH